MAIKHRSSIAHPGRPWLLRSTLWLGRSPLRRQELRLVQPAIRPVVCRPFRSHENAHGDFIGGVRAARRSVSSAQSGTCCRRSQPPVLGDRRAVCQQVLENDRESTPSVRLGGRSAQEASANAVKIRHVTTSRGPLPRSTCDAAAPVNSNVTPAYAHSFKRGNRGTNRTTAPASFRIPRILST